MQIKQFITITITITATTTTTTTTTTNNNNNNDDDDDDDDDAAHPKNWFFVGLYSSNSNLEMLVFEERRKPEYPEKNLS